jgi:hypothetical protein
MIKEISSHEFIFKLSTAWHVFYRTCMLKNEKSPFSMVEISYFYLFALKFYSFCSFIWDYFLYYKQKFTLKFII